MNPERLDIVVERLLAAGAGRATRADLGGTSLDGLRLEGLDHAERAEAVGIAEVFDVLAGVRTGTGELPPGELPPGLSFDELYEYHFGRLTENQRREVEAALAADPAGRRLSELFADLPGPDAEASAAGAALPPELRTDVLRAVGAGRAESALARIGTAARELLESMRATADAFVVLVGSAVTEVVGLGRDAGEPEVALAYSATAEAETVPAALAELPRVRVEHGYLCLALSSEETRGLNVSLVDRTGRAVATARPNNIGVVMFDGLTPGLYGLRIAAIAEA